MLEFLFNLNLIVSLLRRIERKQDEFMATVREAFAENAATANKAFDEISDKLDSLRSKVDQLESALANRELTDEERAAFEETKTALKALDDIVPDALPEVPPVEDEDPNTDGE